MGGRKLLLRFRFSSCLFFDGSVARVVRALVGSTTSTPEIAGSIPVTDCCRGVWKGLPVCEHWYTDHTAKDSVVSVIAPVYAAPRFTQPSVCESIREG